MKIKLMQGDCLERMQELPDKCIDLILTDPPYGINYKSNLQTGNRRSGNHIIVRDSNYFKEISNDNRFPIDWIKEAYRVLKDNSAIYTFCHRKTYSQAEQGILSVGFEIKNCIILNKSNHGMGDLKGSYAPKYEMLIFAVKGRHLLNFLNGREKDVWNVKVKYSGSHHYHPNEKPVSWMLPAITNSSKVGDTILDPFFGSGTTGVACVQTGRNFIGIELDKEYFEIGKQRIKESKNE